MFICLNFTSGDVSSSCSKSSLLVFWFKMFFHRHWSQFLVVFFNFINSSAGKLDVDVPPDVAFCLPEQFSLSLSSELLVNRNSRGRKRMKRSRTPSKGITTFTPQTDQDGIASFTMSTVSLSKIGDVTSWSKDYCTSWAVELSKTGSVFYLTVLDHLFLFQFVVTSMLPMIFFLYRIQLWVLCMGGKPWRQVSCRPIWF